MAIENFSNLIKPLLTFVGFSVAFIVIKAFIHRALIKRVRTKRMKHNVIVFNNLLTYLFFILAIVTIFFYFTGNSLAVGLTAGFLTAALGWALQRPITGMAAWIMVVVKKPFRIGDRILIGSTKGDVIDITLTHIYLKEIGGTINSEEISGRIVMIPNSVMFEQNIINYTVQDDYILDDVGVLITYESNLDKAMQICEKAAKKVMKDFLGKTSKDPYVRIQFQSSGIDMKTRYYVHASERIKISSDLTREIFKAFEKEKDIEIAYPHTEVVLRNKTPKRV